MGAKCYYRRDTWGDIGEGLDNTKKLQALGDSYEASTAVWGKDIYGNGYSDWFIPSKDELKLLLDNIACNYSGGFTLNVYYWSSLEDGNTFNAYRLKADNSSSVIGTEMGTGARNEGCRVRLVRRFK